MFPMLIVACGESPPDAAAGSAAGVEAAQATLALTATATAADCASTTPGPPAQGCVSGALACGATVAGTTLGGDSAWDDEFYAAAFCFPPGDSHSGSERVYTLTAPTNTEVTIQLSSSCADLDLVAVEWNYDGACPTARHLVPECEGDSKRGGDGIVRLQTFTPRAYLIGVDGKNGAVGAFELTVSCKPLRSQEERSKALPR